MLSTNFCRRSQHAEKHKSVRFNPVMASQCLQHFTLANARWVYSSMGDLLATSRLCYKFIRLLASKTERNPLGKTAHTNSYTKCWNFRYVNCSVIILGLQVLKIILRINRISQQRVLVILVRTDTPNANLLPLATGNPVENDGIVFKFLSLLV